MINMPKTYCFEIDCNVFHSSSVAETTDMNMSVENNMLHFLCQTILSKDQPTHAFLIFFSKVLNITYAICNPISEM